MPQEFSNLAYYLGKQIFSNKKLWIALGNLETKLIKNKLSIESPDEPIYITGLARSGTTLMLENIVQNPDCTSHRYRDFPMVFTPYIWNKLLSFCDLFTQISKKHERSHQDGVEISAKSPEALEEILWESFFADLHNDNIENILPENTQNKEFSQFYFQHINKLLLARSSKRYVTKANYNITRLHYLLKLNNSSKAIIMVRDPVSHINSIVRQDRIFSESHRKNPKTKHFMHMSGHYEFGLDKKLINIDVEKFTKIQKQFNTGNDIKAWAMYWSMVYNYAKSLIEQLPKSNVMLCRYEDLCNDPKNTLKEIYQFCNLAPSNDLLNTQSSNIRGLSVPNEINKNNIKDIISITKPIANYFGY
jgi:hypothetical protein